MYSLIDIYHLFLHDALSCNFNLASYKEIQNSIFAFSSKQQMCQAKGHIIKDTQSLIEKQQTFSHWTPNIYCNGQYIKDIYVKGHSEHNLHQINTFMVDFDTEKEYPITVKDILVASNKIGMMPTLILKTPHGYHAYFILQHAICLNSNNLIVKLAIAKEISEKIRQSLKQYVSVDMMCNHFGIARIPREDNIVYFEPEHCYSFKRWIKWSYEISAPCLSLTHTKQLDITKKIVENKKLFKPQTQQKWFHLLLQATHIQGKKGIYGRNNIIFTLALACYASNYTFSACQKLLLNFNQRLKYPLTKNEVIKSITSAYSGKYQAASSAYIKEICFLWLGKNITQSILKNMYWYKHKKKRHERKYSHLKEWEDDLIKYLKQNTHLQSPFIYCTQKKLCETLNIPEKSFTRLIKKLKIENKIIYTIKRGRNGGIKIGLRKKWQQSILLKKKNKQITSTRTKINNIKKREIKTIVKKQYKTIPIKNTS